MQVAKQQAQHAVPLLRLLAPAVRAALLEPWSGGARGDSAQRANYAAAAQPANAMALIKELREKSGAPIGDVKVRAARGLRSYGPGGVGDA